MIFPTFLKQGDTIGVTAPSDGNKKEIDFIRLDSAKQKLFEKGMKVIETEHVRTSIKGRSCDAKTRAKELMSLFLNPEVKAIISAKGGDFLCEMLLYLDWDEIQKNPKWVQGYSDNTGLLFLLTTICNISSIYGNNFNDFGMEHWHESVKNNVQILQGNLIEQHSFDFFEDGFFDKITGLEGYVLEVPVKWKSAREEQDILLEGRLLGGCLDVLLNLVGTKFDCVKKYIHQYKEPTIWFLESFDLNSEELVRGLWQLREAGWFEEAAGFIFGRPCMFESFTDTTYEEAVLASLDMLNVPIILDADIGHKAPQFTMINGAFAKIKYKKGKGSITYA